MMVEGGALEVSEADMIEALTVGQRGVQELIAIQEELLGQGRKPKMEWKKTETPANIKSRVDELVKGKIVEAINQKEKHTRIEAVELVKKQALEQLVTEFPDNSKDVGNLVGDVEYHALRSQVLDSGLRVDGRNSSAAVRFRRHCQCDLPGGPRYRADRSVGHGDGHVRFEQRSGSYKLL